MLGDSVSASNDTHFYVELSKGVLVNFSRWAPRGVLGLTSVDRSFIIRSDPFILWCDVLEEGLGYQTVLACDNVAV